LRDDLAAFDTTPTAAGASYMSELTFPDKHFQERYYPTPPFLAQHGMNNLIDTLYQHVRLECPGHRVLVL
jgi:hypothetical protein